MPLTAYPTVFPAAAAARIGEAILNQRFDKSLAEDCYDLIGYIMGRIFGSGDPVFGSRGVYTDEQLGEMLAKAGESKGDRFDSPAVGDPEPLEALPWTLVLSLVFRIVQRITNI